TGDDRWYEKNIPEALRLYQEHLDILKQEKGNG
ncbi:TPA: addiction module toxin RelE, partial [Legionella pneumophila]|nr:addiction module toxin RelE [Legionella pneumophila]HAT8258201.1 addiction module toxin RelE [Legionella pneumophila]HAT8270691.1 addiction module toxin RelE [Legionella pneumophila]HAT8273816.1 addiction module toxin RelE [Legionella pneumophila]